MTIDTGALVATAPVAAGPVTEGMVFTDLPKRPLWVVLHSADDSPRHRYQQRVQVTETASGAELDRRTSRWHVVLHHTDGTPPRSRPRIELVREDDRGWLPPNTAIEVGRAATTTGSAWRELRIGPLGPGTYRLDLPGLLDSATGRPVTITLPSPPRETSNEVSAIELTVTSGPLPR